MQGVVLSVLDLTLKPRKRIIVEFDLALRHPSDLDHLLVLGKRELLIDLGPIQELEG